MFYTYRDKDVRKCFNYHDPWPFNVCGAKEWLEAFPHCQLVIAGGGSVGGGRDIERDTHLSTLCDHARVHSAGVHMHDLEV